MVTLPSAWLEAAGFQVVRVHPGDGVANGGDFDLIWKFVSEAFDGAIINQVLLNQWRQSLDFALEADDVVADIHQVTLVVQAVLFQRQFGVTEIIQLLGNLCLAGNHVQLQLCVG